MCLSIPGIVTEISEKITVDYSGEKRQADMSLVDINIGDYVLLKERIIIEKVPKQEAIDYLNLLKNVRRKNE